MWYGVQACAEPGGLGDGYRGASDGWVFFVAKTSCGLHLKGGIGEVARRALFLITDGGTMAWLSPDIVVLHAQKEG